MFISKVVPLDDIRIKIDAIDQQLIQLFAERAELVHEVGVVKKREGLQIYAPEREDALLQKLAKMNREAGSSLPEKSIRAIYREIMSAALALEDELKIAYLGPKGSWTHQASVKKFGHSVDYLPKANFTEIFDDVARGKASYGVVPIENSTEGAVTHTLDLFVSSPLKICAQILLRIENCLMANTSRDKIKTLVSHPQVFGQCRDWIITNFPDADLVETSSTAKAAQIAVEKADEGVAAMGGMLSAELYGLNVLEKSVQDCTTNTTRFFIVGEKDCPKTGNDRTSILFALHDRPGALVNALRVFEPFGINLSKIESRPSKQKEWEYIFYADLEGHVEDENVSSAIKELESHCSLLKILGSYPTVTVATES